MPINAHQAFENISKNGYRQNLTAAEDELEELGAARDLVRATIKSAFSNWQSRIGTSILFEDIAVASFAADAALPSLSPKFRGQGSYVYATLNQPTHNPPQEMDFDDGMFLPTSYLSNGGEAHPIVASAGYFQLVESALAPLCEKQGWTLNPDRARPSCVRVGLNNGRSHVDIALYAIPDEQYHALLEKVATASALSFAADSQKTFDSLYETIPYDQIMLAHRDEGWKISDPRKLERWFVSAIKEHGEQLRRVCRYLKGWRDNNWHNCKLSSIALMACVVRFYEESYEDFVGRDDKALQAIAALLPQYLSETIPNPVVDGRLDEGWDNENQACRQEFVSEAQSLNHALDSALAANSSQSGSAKLYEIFGMHFPLDTSLIEVEQVSDTGKPSSLAKSAAIIGISGAQQAALAQSAAAALQSQGLATKPWGPRED